MKIETGGLGNQPSPETSAGTLHRCVSSGGPARDWASFFMLGLAGSVAANAIGFILWPDSPRDLVVDVLKALPLFGSAGLLTSRALGLNRP